MFENKVLCQIDTEYGCMMQDFINDIPFRTKSFIETIES